MTSRPTPKVVFTSSLLSCCCPLYWAILAFVPAVEIRNTWVRKGWVRYSKAREGNALETQITPARSCGFIEPGNQYGVPKGFGSGCCSSRGPHRQEGSSCLLGPLFTAPAAPCASSWAVKQKFHVRNHPQCTSVSL